MIERARRPTAVSAKALPGIEDSLPEPQLGETLRKEDGSIDVMVHHAPNAAYPAYGLPSTARTDSKFL